MAGSLAVLFGFFCAGSAVAADSLQARMDRQEKVIKVLPVKGYTAPKLTIDLLVDVPIAKITQVVGACADYVGVIPRVQKVIVHKRGIPNHVCELFLDMPFPFADVRSTIAYAGTITANEVVMRYRQIRGDYRLHNGLWRLRAQGKKTHIHYSLHIDLGKPLPKWVINIFTKGALRQTVSEVTRRARSL
jgi:ribosome-associated toxin RatA of RatAB toxin-antitoxin module